ncbi:hypothetical protein BC628DRAFT_1317906 [Trametes gibbosa]|nr:hypothetical protein BC628DRAFT_1317906 [Trametes gibbosa]
MSVIGHTHGTAAIPSDQNGSQPMTSSSSDVPGRGLHILISNNAATRVPASTVTPISAVTPGHGHPGAIDAHTESTDTTAWTPGHGHGGRRFVFPPVSTSASSPVNPRPSARVARRSGMFTTADEAEGGNGHGSDHGHLHFDVVHNGAIPPPIEAEELPSAELDGRFEEPVTGPEDVQGVGERASGPLGDA